MDAQIYEFKCRKPEIWPHGYSPVDVAASAMNFAAWYVGAMFSFHAMMIRCAIAPMREACHG